MYKKPLLLSITFALQFFYLNAYAANWLMLQGTEPPKRTHKLWGFVQPTYVSNKGDELAGLIGAAATPNNGKLVGNNVVAPEFEDKSDFNFRRARFGARGRINENINYFTLFEVAPNLLTYDPFGERARNVALDHMSATFSYIDGARIRVGLFKTPGPEEIFQAIHTFDYIEFTDFVAREMLERFVSGNQNCPGCSAGNSGTPTNTAYGFNGARDWGIQIFDAIKSGEWTWSYALMMGRGEGIHEKSDSDSNKETYVYGSAEYALPGGKGPGKHGVKIFAWQQKGKREFESDTSGESFDRIRQGIGFKALGKLFGGQFRQRISAELMMADGMIFIAPFGNVKGGNLMYATDKGNKAKGISLDYGFYMGRKWQFDLRFDRNNLLYEQATNIGPHSEREITGKTVGVTYRVKPKQRITFNYIIREAKAPNPQPNAGLANNVPIIVDSLGNRIAAQYTWIF
jgi:hypothetical protein